MDYPVVRVDELPNAASPATAKREVDEALDVETFGFNRTGSAEPSSSRSERSE